MIITHTGLASWALTRVGVWISHSPASYPLGRYERGSCDSSCFFHHPVSQSFIHSFILFYSL